MSYSFCDKSWDRQFIMDLIKVLLTEAMFDLC